jgi:Protein of unknown function (DUF4240)
LRPSSELGRPSGLSLPSAIVTVHGRRHLLAVDSQQSRSRIRPFCPGALPQRSAGRALAPVDIVAFQALLDHARNDALTRDLWGAAARIFGGWCSDHGFDYFRLWLIGQGRATYEDAVTSPDSLASVPAITRLAGRHRRAWAEDEEWPEWELLDYVAKEAYELAGNGDDECGDDFHAAVETQLSSATFKRTLAGERWSAKDEAAASLKIPWLAARFPLG